MNYEETLSTLKAIQASYSPMPFLLDPDAEPRFVINSDERTITIPEEFKFLAVKMDHLSERIYFDIPRYFDGEDLATKICVVQYVNANGEEAVEGIAAIVDVDYTSESGKIIFRWDVDNNVTKYAGDVSFSVRFYTISDDNRFTYSWNTVPATLPILDTIDNTGRTVTENYPTELLQWQYRMTELDRTISEKIEKASASIDADTKASQAARKGAEDAEARVNAIVAGNEAYTKQQSHDLFALALRGSAEAAKSITFYPDKGSNVVVAAHGFTKQEGSGDASPENIRIISVGGMQANLFPGFSKGGVYDIETGEFSERQDGNLVSEKIPCKPNTKYFISVNHKANVSLGLRFWKTDGSYIEGKSLISGAANPYYPFTTPSKAASMVVTTYSSKTKPEDYYDSVIVYGSRRGPYTTYTGSEYGVALEQHGANMLPKNMSGAFTQTGVTFTPNEDGTISVKGTATVDSDYYTFGSYLSYDVKFVLAPGEYFLSGNKEASGVVLYLLSRTKDGVKNVASANTTAGVKFTVNEYTPITAFLVRAVKNQVVNGIVKPMLNVGSTALPYTIGFKLSRKIAPLTAPLCLGDKLITKVKSGCDKVLTFDGSEDEGWVADSASGTGPSGSKRMYAKLSFNVPNGDGAVKSAAYFNYLVNVTNNSLFTGQKDNVVAVMQSQTLSSGAVYVRISGISTVEALQAYLSAHPLTVWYRSTNYTEAADIPVSLETHQRVVLVLDGTEPFVTNNIGGWTTDYAQFYATNIAFPCNQSGNGVCSHGLYQEPAATDKSMTFVNASGGVYLRMPKANVGETAESCKAYLAAQYAAGTPITIVYELATPITYAHDPVDFIASPNEEGVWVITGEADGTVSAEYNKNVTKAFEDILTRISALELHALEG